MLSQGRNNMSTLIKSIKLILTTVLLAGLSAVAAQEQLTVVFGAPVLTTDPGISAGTQAQTIRFAIYEGLVEFDESGSIQPALATSWSVSEDQTEWTFSLREGVTFHDGTPFNAAAVQASLERILDPENGFSRRSTLSAISEVVVVDEHTVRLVTAEPFGPLLAHLASDAAVIVSPAALAEYGADIGWHPVGTGAFKYASHVAEQSVTVVRNDNYWAGPPALNEIRFLAVPEAATRITMLEAGEADIVVNIPGFDVPRLDTAPGLSVRLDPSTRVGHVGINTSKAPFDDQLVRQALNHAINREAIVHGILRNIGQPARSIVASATVGFSDSSDYTYDPERARELLAEAGYPTGFAATLLAPQGRYYMDRETAVVIQAQLKDIGIDLNLQIVDWSTYLELLREPADKNSTQLYWLGWETGTMHIQYILDTVFQTSQLPPAGWNTMFYQNEDVSEMINQARRTVDDAEQQALYEEIQATVMDDAPWVPVYEFQQITGLRDNVVGLQVLPTEVFVLKHVTLE
jgi:peptide/nickel transport system substrate-binding protein